MTGKEIRIHERNGSYEVDLWVEAPAKTVKVTVPTNNRFEALQEVEEDGEGEEMTMDFIRRGKCL